MRRDCTDVLICVISELRLIDSESINVPNNAIRRFFYPIKRLLTFGTHYKTKNVFIVNNIYDIIDKVNADVPVQPICAAVCPAFEECRTVGRTRKKDGIRYDRLDTVPLTERVDTLYEKD